MRAYRATICSLIAASFLASSVGVANAGPGAKPESPAASKGEAVVIDGRTFGAKDGLVTTTGSVVVGAQEPGTISAAAYTRYNFGTSYTSTNSGSTGLNYGGEAYASGGIYGTLRVIQVCFQYRRDGVNLIPWTCSSANSSTGTWRPGTVVSRTVWDSLNPSAPPTTFHFKTSQINPNIV